MLVAFCAIVAGLAVLVWGADRFVRAAAAAARYFGMPPLFVGMVVIGFGTSAPELLVSSIAAYQGNAGIALGNAYGSNISNIALILGLTALIAPIPVAPSTVTREIPVLLAVTVFAGLLLWDGMVTRIDSGILLTLFAILLIASLKAAISGKDAGTDPEMKADDDAKTPISRHFIWLVIGLATMVGGSRLLVWGAVEVATRFGVSDLVIGLTIVAIGTSLPELASSLVAARKGEHELALGNIIGSNIFNTLMVVGVAAFVRPMTVSDEVKYRDVPAMLALSALLYVFARWWSGTGTKGKRLERWEGMALLACYVLYTIYLVVTAAMGRGMAE